MSNSKPNCVLLFSSLWVLLLSHPSPSDPSMVPLQEHCNEKVIVYFLTCASVDFFSAALAQSPQLASARLHALHGKMKQQAREATMTAYSTGTAGRPCQANNNNLQVFQPS